MRFILTALSLLITWSSYGQDFLITMKNDTVRGDLKLLSYDLMDRVQVATAGKKKAVYTAVQIRQMMFKGETYTPVRFDNSIRMMKTLRSGFLSLYAFRLPNQMTYDGRLLVKLGSPPQEVPNLGFKKFVGGLVEDCPIVSDKVKTGDLDRNNVEELVDEYNKCVQETQEKRLEKSAQSVSNPTVEFITQLKTRVTASDLATKNDVNDLLDNLSDKVRKNEPIPAYLKEGLKGYLGQREDFRGDMEQLLSLLK